MEEIKFQTEFRKQRSQALEKTERLKKKSRFSEKKDQKAEVKRKIENSLPVVPPLDQAFHCSGCTNTHSWRGWLCIDDQKHQREWMVKERRLMVKDAFQEQAKAVNGFSKLKLTIKALPLYICHRCHRPSYLNDRTHCPCES